MGLEKERTLEAQYVMHTFKRKDVQFVSGEGMYLQDDEGKRYLDFLSGIGVCSLGHCHPVVVSALQDQAAKLIHVSNYFYIEKRGEVAQKLSELLNGSPSAAEKAQLWKSFFANSGAEANECAIKLARLYAKQRAKNNGLDPESAPSVVVTLVKSFHGRTLATLAATGQSALHVGFEPMPEGFLPTPINDQQALERLFDQIGSSVCAVLFEPIQGESGVHPCTEAFAQCIRKLCDDHGALMICDEVQCGVFRTGKPFAFQHLGVVPDVVTMAKGIASGMPAAACAARGVYGDVLSAGQHGSTFGGSDLAVSAMQATLEELSKPAYGQSVEKVGALFQSQLAALKFVTDVRGRGLMQGVDLIESVNANELVDAALAEGLVINATGPHTLRFLPPLICGEADVYECIQRLQQAFEATNASSQNRR